MNERHTIVGNETAFQGIIRILFPVAGEMKNMTARKMRDNFLYSCRYILDAQPNQKLAFHMFLDALKLLFGVGERVSIWNVRLNDNRQLKLVNDGRFVNQERFQGGGIT
jgi:hypothetical protein